MYYNCHIHLFGEPDVPRQFLPLGLVRILANRQGFRFIGRTLNLINPFSDNDLFDRYVRFVEIGRLGSPENIFRECEKFYPKNSAFIVMSMDMAFMGAGKVPQAYEKQIEDLARLRDKFPQQVIPFIHVDPRRREVMALLGRSIEQWGFRGVKLYPPLGVYPTDKLLMEEVYPYCVEKNLPVISHGSPYNPVRFKGSMKELHQLLGIPADDPRVKGKKRRELTPLFTHPANFIPVLEKFSKLRLCIAHFGSEHYWDKYIHKPGEEGNWFVLIKNMIEQYDNLYTDISFTMNRREFFPLLKVLLADKKLRSRILFGSDYYMVETRADERTFGLDLRAYLGEDYFEHISLKNPRKFLDL
jgi:predicted TIM-barrel fold metal-dependent hydrolase